MAVKRPFEKRNHFEKHKTVKIDSWGGSAYKLIQFWTFIKFFNSSNQLSCISWCSSIQVLAKSLETQKSCPIDLTQLLPYVETTFINGRGEKNIHNSNRLAL